MASAELNERVGKVVAYPPLVEMSAEQRREFHVALLEADAFEDLVGKWQAAILEAEQNRPELRVAEDTQFGTARSVEAMCRATAPRPSSC